MENAKTVKRKRAPAKKEQPVIKPETEPKVFRPKRRIEISADDMRKLQCR